MKKILMLIIISIATITTLTACTPAPKYNGQVIITELDHVDFRPQMGKFPMRTEKWEVTVCPNAVNMETKCWTSGVEEDEFSKLETGDTLTASDGNLTLR